MMQKLQLELLAGEEDAIAAVVDEMKERETEVDKDAARTQRFKFVNRTVNESTGMMPLHVACMSGKCASIRAILDLDPDLTALDAKGRTPLHCAAESKSVAAIGPLLAALESKGWAGRSLGFRDERGLTPLHLSCGAPDALRALVSCKGARENLWNTPGLLRRVVSSTHSAACLRALVGEEPESPGGRGANSHAEALAVLVNERDEASGKTLFVSACEHGCVETCEVLLALGADPMSQDDEGQNGLHWATFLGHDEVCAWIREQPFAEALDGQRDHEGRTPREWSSAELHDSAEDAPASPPPVPMGATIARSSKAEDASLEGISAKETEAKSSPREEVSRDLISSAESKDTSVSWRSDRASLDEAMARDLEALQSLLPQ